MSIIRYAIFLSLVFLVGAVAQAKSEGESMFLLKEALMESNGDYNKHKKKFNHEEFDRADKWTERNNQAILINERKAFDAELQKLNDEFSTGDREVSSNDTLKKGKDQ